MKLVLKAYESAKKDIDLNWKELDGEESNYLITECYKAVDGLGNPEMIDDSKMAWCSAYVNKKIQDAGGRGTRSPSARSWLRWGKETNPFEGCIVVFKRGMSLWEGHVGFFIKADYKYVYCLGGNQSNDVNISKFLKTSVLGYRTSLD